ncbi:MAG: DUF2178 domain-containing protein [Candidatus Bathyarchaeota archaeon]|nr:DUF2178 domain-containing protein [Candidatus Bathyarchaeota archaeon]
MKSKLLITLGIMVVAIVLVTLTLYLTNTQSIQYDEIAILAIIVIIVIFALYILSDMTKNVSKGLPVGDERTKNITYQAGYYAFIAAIWSAVFAPLFVDIIFNYELPTDQVSGAVVLISGLVFAISYIYLMRKRRA